MSRFAPSPLSLRQLQYVVAVAETLSFRRAAELCHVSQPSLSAQLAELERALGVRLFERDRRKVLVTAAGRGLIERARRVLIEAEHLAQAARQAQDPLAGEFRVGVIPTISPYLLPVVAPRLRARFKQLRVFWVEDKTAVLAQGLESGLIDAAVLALEADLPPLEKELIGEDPFRLAVAPGHPLAKKSAVRRDELRGAKVLLLEEGHCLREQALEFCSSARTSELEFRATSLPTLVQMVAAGAGVTLLPALSVPTETRRAQLVVRPIAERVPSRTIAMVWRKHSPLAEAFKKVAAEMREVFAAATRVAPS